MKWTTSAYSVWLSSCIIYSNLAHLGADGLSAAHPTVKLCGAAKGTDGLETKTHMPHTVMVLPPLVWVWR